MNMAVLLSQIFEILKNNYGSQGWWPVTEKSEIIPTYKFRNSFTEKQILEIIIGTFLTQNTNWNPNVTTSITNLNRNNLINLEKLKKIDEKQFAKLIQSSGYYNQKAENIKLFVKFLHENPIKKLKKLETEKLRVLLLEQKGIGPETADSIVLYAFQKPSFVIDAYTRRIFLRLKLISENSTYEEIQKLFQNNLEKNPVLYNEFHALIVEHAKRFCKKKPECNECCLKDVCKIFNR